MSKVHLTFIAIVALTSTSLLAGIASRQVLRIPVVKKIEQIRKLNKLNVYLNRRLIIKRERIADRSTTINGQVNSITKMKVIKETISSRAKGRILFLREDFGGYDLWVSFDKKCKTKECCFLFKNEWEGPEIRMRRSTKFTIVSVPKVEGYKTKMKRVLGTYKYFQKYFIFLKYKHKELEKVETTTTRHTGY